MSRPVVLVVEREPVRAAALARSLGGCGALLRAAADAGEVAGELRRFAPQVLVLGALAAVDAGPLLELVAGEAAGCRVVRAPGTGHHDGDTACAEAVAGALGEAGDAATVLVVEDVLVNLEMLADVLAARGHRVLRTVSGEEALAVAAELTPDLVVMDLYLPGMSGVEAVRRLRERPPTSATPVLMLSADGSDAAVAEAMAAGAEDYVVKPFSPRRLVEKVERLLRREVASGA